MSGAFGDIHVGQWLLPANEMIAQWIDPFYDHDMNAHSYMMGSVGYGNVFYNGGFGENGGAGGAQNASFNRRQEEIVQYMSPNVNGFDFRFMYLDSSEFDFDTCVTDEDTDARFYSLGVYNTALAGTEFRLTYNDLDDESNANYDYAITPTGTVQGGDASAIGLGMTQWF